MSGRYAHITDEAIAELRARIGVPIPRREAYLEAATPDAIRHFALGIGDPNPLWTDDAHARATRWGGIIAPPCLLYGMDVVSSGMVGGLPGVHAMFAGTNWEWYRPVRAGERITSTSRLSDIIEKSGAFAARSVLQGYQTVFHSEHGDIVATAKAFCLRTERDTAQARGKYEGIRLHQYTPEALERIAADYDREEIRGAVPRYWEDVSIGEELQPIVKGPLTITDIIAWLRGWGGLFIRAHKIALAYYRRHPAAAIHNELGIPEGPERVHWDSAFARQAGVPAAYDYGPQRISWLANLMTHWVGDDGRLRRLDVQVRRFNLIGDTTWCKGRVVDKYQHGEAYEVECEVWAENQRGEVTAQGRAVASLPAKVRSGAAR